MKKIIPVLLLLWAVTGTANAQTSRHEKWKDTISSDADFHNYIGYRIAGEVSKDSAYRYHNTRAIIVFFDFNDSGRLMHYFCAGQTKQLHIDIYKMVVEDALKRADTSFIHKFSKYTLMQVLMEQGDSTRTTAEAPDVEYGGFITPKGDYFEKRAIPYWGFNLLHNEAAFNRAYRLTEEKPLKMLYPITITLRHKRHATIHQIKRVKPAT